MIGYLKGNVLELETDHCLLNVHGVGYRVFVSDLTRSRMHIGTEIGLHIHTAVREDAILLYGFHRKEDYGAFQQLISVSGIGPRVAMGVLSSITAEQLAQAIHQKKASLLTKLPGIGKKTADRMILELKDRMSLPEDAEDISPEPGQQVLLDDMLSETAAALASLGYTQQEIRPALKAAENCKTVADAIKVALKELNKF